MRITVPEEIMRLTVPTCTPSRDKPLVIVSSLELGGAGLHIFVWVEAVQLVGCLGNSLQEHRRLTAQAQAVGAGCSCRVLTTEFSYAAVALQLRASHTTQAPLQMTPPVLWLLAAFLLLSEVLHRSPLDSPLSVWPCWTEVS